MVSKNELERSRIRNQTFALLIDRIAGLGRTTVKTVGAVGCFWFIYLSIGQLAGKDTTIQAVLSAIVDMSIDRHILIFITFLTVGGYWRERRTRLRTVSEQSDYIKHLEELMDPSRSSSGLKSDGLPRREDIDGS